MLPFGNFSYSLYGLASGGQSWATALRDHPQADDQEIYRISLQLILEQPNLFLRGVLYNYSMFFSNTGYGLYSYMGGEGSLATALSYAGLLLLSCVGIGNWLVHRDDPFLGFVLVSALGLLLSVPFLPPTDAFRLRAYAASIFTLALLPAMGLYAVMRGLRLERFSPAGEHPAYAGALGAFSALVTAAVLLGPFAVRGRVDPPRASATRVATPGRPPWWCATNPPSRCKPCPKMPWRSIGRPSFTSAPCVRTSTIFRTSS